MAKANKRIENKLVVDLVDTAIKAEDEGCSVWEKTGLLIMENSGSFFGDDDISKKDRQKAFIKLLDDGCNLDEIPEEGPSRQGDNILLRKKNNKIKWSSWTATSRMVQNLTDIWKGLEKLKGSDSEVFPNGVLISRYELLNLLSDLDKGPKETPLKTIERCIELAVKKVAETGINEIDAIESIAGKFNTAFSDHKQQLGK